jgi:putative ABC transport system substrate-binding protein
VTPLPRESSPASRPGTNVTGQTFFDPELSAKRLEIIKDAIPSANRIAVLLNPDNLVKRPVMESMGRAAELLKLQLQPFEARRPDEFQGVVADMVKTGADAVAVTTDAVFISNAQRIAELMAVNRLPSVGDGEFSQAGGTIGHGANGSDLFYRGASFVHKILRGANPAEIPVEQPTKFELVVNLKTAKAIGLTIPESFVWRADNLLE